MAEVKDTKPGTVANPTNTSCLLESKQLVGDKSVAVLTLEGIWQAEGEG